MAAPGGFVMIGHVEIPTADGAVREPTPHRRLSVAGVAFSVALVALVWPVLPFSQAPSTATGDHRVVAAPRVDAPPQQATLWSAPIPLPDPDARVVGFGSSVVAVTPGAIWPASLLRDGEWSKLLGLPLGYTLLDEVGVERADGFSLIGVSGDKTIFFDFDADGRFRGARTIRGVAAGAVASLGGSRVAVFDAKHPVGRIVGERTDPIEAPGRVTAAAANDPWLIVLTTDGVVHATADAGRNWSPLGDGFSALVSSEPVVAVGKSAGVGLHRFEGERGLVRIDRAPIGPTVAWGSGVAVHDWSNDSVWASSADGWQRIPLWSRDGFHGSFRTLVSGTDVPTVVGESATGEPAVWRVGA